ncbi:MAG TPA: hypothetical protein PKW95_23695 [bacterium]|nr:hypothetical protein [bacterium]
MQDREEIYEMVVNEDAWYRATSAKRPPEITKGAYRFHFFQLTKSGRVVIQTNDLFVEHRRKMVPFSCWVGKRAWAALSRGQDSALLAIHPEALRYRPFDKHGPHERFDLLLGLSARGAIEAMVEEDIQ